MKRSFMVNTALVLSGLFPIIDSNLLLSDLKTQRIQLLNYICTVYSQCIIKLNVGLLKRVQLRDVFRPIIVKIHFMSETLNHRCRILY